jgi:phytoene desaturase
MRIEFALNDDLFEAAVTKAVQPNIRRALIEIRSRAQAKFQLPKTGREYYRPRSAGGGKYRASAKGQAPAIRTGLLFRSWFVTQPSPLEGQLKIDTKGKRTLGVFVGEDYIPADIVIANADYHHTETKLLDDRHRTYHERYWRRKTMSPSSLLIYLGVKKQVPGLLHHTMFFDADWHGHFNQVFKEKGWVSRPLFYVGTPSKSDSKVAPKNKENIVILVPIASGVKVDDAHRKELVESVIARMEARLGVPFAKDITVKQVRDIEYFEDTFNAYKGNAFGLAHTLTQTAMLRPRMQSSKVKNLFFVGQYTNPGTGVPIVVLSGKVVANLVNNTIEHEDRRSNHL